MRSKGFEFGICDGEIRSEFEPVPSEIVGTEHWCSTGSANTDLDVQIQTHGIPQIIAIGLIAHICPGDSGITIGDTL